MVSRLSKAALEEYTKPEIMDGDNKCECDDCRQQMEEKGLEEELEVKAYKRRTELRDAFNEAKIPDIACSVATWI